MRFCVLIISPPGYPHSECFREVAETINDALLKLGHQSCVSSEVILGAQHIVLGSNLLLQYPVSLPTDSIIYNLEQVKDNELWINPHFLSIVRRHTLWDYSNQNAEEFCRQGITVNAVLPLCFYEGLVRVPQLTKKDIDVVFVGSMNNRRQAVLIAMQEAGLKVGWLFNSYGGDRDAVIARTKLLLNVHFHKAKILEQVRISYYLANRLAVLSEDSSDLAIDMEWSQGVVFAKYEDLVLKALELCADDMRREQLGTKGFEFIRQRSLLPYLGEALKTLGI